MRSSIEYENILTCLCKIFIFDYLNNANMQEYKYSILIFICTQTLSLYCTQSI